MSTNPIKSREEIDLKKTLDELDSLFKAMRKAADKLPGGWQEKRCDDFTDKITEAEQIAKEALELW